MSPRNEAIRELGLARTLSNLKTSRLFLVHALATLPDSAAGMPRDLITDARDGIDLAIDALEEQK